MKLAFMAFACLLASAACGGSGPIAPDAGSVPAHSPPYADAGSPSPGDAAAPPESAPLADAAAPDAAERDGAVGALAVWKPIAPGVEVPTAEGAVRGKVVGRTRAFLGVPYAAPPVGMLRFRAPQPALPHSGVRDATALGNVCPQSLPILGVLDNSDEDCLTLNIWAPEPAPTTALPVMVWIHGGAFQVGDGGGSYDGQRLAEAGQVVVVTLNYRLGALGFLAHPALAAESAGGSAGNYGIRDQQAALAWVRANIAAFGGDPTNITAFGESAGAHSLCIHLASPTSAPLFDKAIVQSGLCARVAHTAAEAFDEGERFAAALGCPAGDAALDCLRQAPVDALLAHSDVLGARVPGGIMFLDDPGLFFFQPTLDPEVFPQQLSAAFAAGAVNRVPVLHGANGDEGALFQTGLVGGAPIASRDDFMRVMGIRFPAHVADITAMYTPAASGSWSEALSQATGDFMFLCPAQRMARRLHAAGIPNYLYYFTAPIDSLLLPALSGRALHSADIPYLFGNGFPLGSVAFGKEPLQADMVGFWTRFARSGDPNDRAAPTLRFDAYDPGATVVLRLDVPLALVPIPKQRECALWQTIEDAR